MAEKRTSQVTGRVELLREMNRRLGGHLFAAVVGVHSQRQGVTYRWPSGKVHTTRPKFSNMDILERSIRSGRDPVFLDQVETLQGEMIWRKGIDGFMGGDDGALVRAATQLAQHYVRAIQDHIEMGRGKDGRMAQVHPLTFHYKRARAINRGDTDRPGLKPLYDTGQLSKAFFGEGEMIR